MKKDFYKLLRIMKLTSLLFFIAVFSVMAETTHSQVVKVSIDKENAVMHEVLDAIELQTEYLFVYNKKKVNVNQVVSVQASEKPVELVLEEMFKNTGLTYKIVGNHIVLSHKPVTPSDNRQQSGIQVSGTVIDENGEAIIGVNVVEKGTTNGIVTDFNGHFSLWVSGDAILQVSYIGYNSQEIKVNNRTTIQIRMTEDNLALDEVVIIGYGTQKKVNLTGAVSTLSTEQIKDRAQTNVLSAMQGTVPGVTIISRPGEEPSINFRGRGNLGTSEPLYIIDGAIADASFFANLDPNSIESISFLKDAASSAIYGSRAAYGVVLVTTKQGKDGHIQVNYSGMVGGKMLSYKPKLVNSWEYAELFNEAKYNSNPDGGRSQGFTDEEIGWLRDGSKPDLYPNTNWIDLIYDDLAVTTQHSLNFMGGSEKVRYFAGLGYIYDTDNMPGRNNQRYNMNFNVSSDLTKWLTFKGGVKYIQRNKKVNTGTPSLLNVLIVPSTFVARQSNGEWGSVDAGREASATFAGGNPLRAYDYGDWNQSKIANTMIDLGIDIKPMPGLVISGQGVYQSLEDKYKSFVATKEDVPSFLNSGEVISGTGNTINSMDMKWQSNSRLLYTATANYSWSNKVHYINALVGTSYEHYRYEMLEASRENFPADSFKDMSGGATSGAKYQNNSSANENKMLSYFARLNYVFMDRYLLEANIRADASSRFHKDNRWGYFPSFSAGWRISEENFFQPASDWLNNLKLRGSYGTLGNINNVGDYDYFANYTSIENIKELVYTFDNDPVKALQESRPANPGLTWEKVALTDIGIDFDLWNGKLSGMVDYYIKNTSNILLQYNVPAETGITSAPSQNIAKVRNTGLEIALIHRNKIGDIAYLIGGNISTNRNRIKNLATSNDIINNLPSGHGVGKYILREGESIGSFYGFKSDGLYTQAEIDAGRYYTYGGVTPQAGDTKFVPKGTLAYGEAITNDDRTILGNDVPDFTYGLNLNVMYKGFDLTVVGQGVSGTKVAFEVYQIHPFFHGQDNPREYHLKRWTETNPNPRAAYPRIYDASSPHTTYNRAFNDYHLFNADYYRFKTITLGYTIPQVIITRLGISSLKMYLTGENLLTIRGDKDMKDFDPETAGSVVRNLGTKSFAFGINVTF